MLPAAQLINLSAAKFGSWKEPPNTDLIDPEFAEEERKLFHERLSQKEQDRAQVDRMAYLQL